MKINKTLFAAITVMLCLPNIAFSESIVCKGNRDSEIQKFEATAEELNETPQWLDAEIDFGFLKKDQELSLKPLFLGDTLNYNSVFPEIEFLLELGQYKGAGKYVNSKITFLKNKGRRDEKLIEDDLNCELSGNVIFVNRCEGNKNNIFTSYSEAIFNHRLNDVQSLLYCGVNPNSVVRNGCSSALIATDRKCGTGIFESFSTSSYTPYLLDMLLSTGVDLEAKDPVTLETVLHKISRRGDTSSLRFLIKNNANLNAQDIQGYTALMRAVERYDVNFIKALVKEDIDLEIRNSAGQTAADIAISIGAEYLLKHLNPAVKIQVHGMPNGQCMPLELHVEINKPLEIELMSMSNEMFMMSSADLNFSIMTNGNSSKSVKLEPIKAGHYKFTCGTHGGTQYEGKIIAH